MKSRIKIFLALAAIFLIALFATIRIGQKELLPRYNEAAEDTLVDISHILASVIANSAGSGATGSTSIDPVQLESLLAVRNAPLKALIKKKMKSDLEMRVYVTDKKGLVLFDSSDPMAKGKDYSQWNDIFRTLKGEYGARSTRLDPEDPLSSTLYVASPIFKGDQLIGVVSVGKPVRSFHSFITAAQTRLYISVLIIAILGLGFLFYMSLRKERLEAREYVDNYVHQLTHEIKSPIAAILGASEILGNSTNLKASENKLIHNIHLESERLQQLSEQLLEVAALENRKRPLKTESFDLVLLIDEILDSVSIRLQKKSVSVKFSHPHEVFTKGDRFLIWRALANLIQNAIDFSPKDSAIEVQLKDQVDHFVLNIIDQGPGIPEFARNRIFERFYSTERPDTGRKGTGLGLVFTKEVLEQHKGQIELENLNPSGCKIKVSLPK